MMKNIILVLLNLVSRALAQFQILDKKVPMSTI